MRSGLPRPSLVDELGLDDQLVGAALEDGQLLGDVDRHGGRSSATIRRSAQREGDSDVSKLRILAQRAVVPVRRHRCGPSCGGARADGHRRRRRVRFRAGHGGARDDGRRTWSSAISPCRRSSRRRSPTATGAKRESSVATRSAACSRAWRSTIPRRSSSCAPTRGARPLYQLLPGKSVRVETDDDGRLLSLRYLAQGGALLSVDAPRRRLRRRQHAAALRACGPSCAPARSARRCSAPPTRSGLPDAVTMQLAEVFSGDIDFYHDLRRGDRFAVVYEMRDIDGAAARARASSSPRSSSTRASRYRAFLWRGADGSEAYYTRGRQESAQGLPALAGGIHAHHVGLLAGAIPSVPADLARAQGRRFRRADRHPGARGRRRQGHLRRPGRTATATSSSCSTPARTRPCTRICRASRRD